jgi:glutamate 5-kinase
MSHDGVLDIERLENLVDQIIELKKMGYNILLVSSGAVATGRGATQNIKLKFQNIVEERQILASIGQSRLIEIYNQILKKKGFISAQVLLTKEDFRLRSHYLNTYNFLQGLVKNVNVLPIINENDVTSINELMFTDNDELSALIAIQMHVKQLIILTSVEGVYDQNPKHPDAKMISTLDLNMEESWPKIATDKSLYGRGGMLSKLAAARKAAHFGVQTHIANAGIPDVITRLVHHHEPLGTTIVPYKQQKGIKRWLVHTPSSKLPAVVVNEGLSQILEKKEKAVSILPVGITSIIGEFEKGDLVSIKNNHDKTLGLGVAGYNSQALNLVLGQKDQKVFIHYNKISMLETGFL